MATQSLGLVVGQLTDLSYGSYSAQLSESVRTADLVRLAGSTEQDQVDDRHEALVEMQRSVTRHMESTPEMVDVPATRGAYDPDILIGGRCAHTRGVRAHRQK